jgi:hypothetical protein
VTCLLLSPYKSAKKRLFYDACRPGNVSELPRIQFDFLDWVEEVLRVKPGTRVGKVETSVLTGTPTADHGW